MVRTQRSFPANWENVSPISQIIENTRFIVFKSPIDAPRGLKFRKEQEFKTSDLLFQMTQRGHQLGMIINVSFCSRYYDPRVFEGICQYKHILCPTAGYTTREDVVKKFISTVDNFLGKCKDNCLLIGVHCSDGINRSGYLICRYLIDRLHMGSDAALDAFEKARGHSISRGATVLALHRAVAGRRQRDQISPNEAEAEEDRKRKRKAAPDEMYQQLAMLEQSFSKPAVEQSPTQVPEQVPVPVAIGPRLPKQRKEEVEEGEEFEDDEFFDDDDAEAGSNDGDFSTAKRRRLRRKKLTKKFKIMRSGNFAAIQEMRQEEELN